MDLNATLIGEMIAFAILIWFCVRYIWPHLTHAIDARQKTIADGLAAADRARIHLTEANAKAASEIDDARRRAGEILDRAQQQANQVLEQARQDADAQARRQRAGAEQEVAQMAQQARDALQGQLGRLVVQGASKIVQREIDPAAHRALIEQLVAEL